jgi:hypothetical protein
MRANRLRFDNYKMAIHALLGLAGLLGCAHTAPEIPVGEKLPSVEIHVVFKPEEYDGIKVSGLLLVASDNGMTIDRRMVEASNNGIASIVDCETGLRIRGWVLPDSFPGPTSDQDRLHLEPREFFGKRVTYWIFNDDERGPKCIEIQNSFSTEDVPKRRAVGDRVRVIAKTG